MISPSTRRSFHALPAGRLRRFDGWGMVASSMGYGYRATTPEEVEGVLAVARTAGRPLVPRGNGYSYGDTALNAENVVLDLTSMNRVLAWNPKSGVIRVEPGVTIRDLWRHTIGDGWWPAVVPGAMYPTIGGCLAVNAHGKNNWRAGTIGDHVLSADMMLPSGETVVLGPAREPELFRAAVGGLGMLGIFTAVELQLKRVQCGLLGITEYALPTFAAMFDAFERHAGSADYLVGWIDAFAGGASLGRGLLQAATACDGPECAGQALSAEAQDLPPDIFGFLPRSALWMAMKPAVNDAGMHLLNTLRYLGGTLRSGRTGALPNARFHFFHDYVPNWKRAWQPGGILQYQVFVPSPRAREVFSALLAGAQTCGLVPYLAVMKRHKQDDFLLGYNVDGYSLSLDFHQTAGNRTRLEAFLRPATDSLVLPAGGKFYLAKDAILTPDQARRSMGDDAVNAFVALKDRLDPTGLLRSDLYRRLFAPTRGIRRPAAE